METLFLDTNVVIRYVTNDDPGMAQRSRDLLKQAELGSLALIVSESVVVEVVQVLSSPKLYNLPRERVAQTVSAILGLRGLKTLGKQTLLRALDLWATASVDFVDALSVAQMERQKIGTIASFDRDFDRFPRITRREP